MLPHGIIIVIWDIVNEFKALCNRFFSLMKTIIWMECRKSIKQFTPACLAPWQRTMLRKLTDTQKRTNVNKTFRQQTRGNEKVPKTKRTFPRISFCEVNPNRSTFWTLYTKLHTMLMYTWYTYSYTHSITIQVSS